MGLTITHAGTPVLRFVSVKSSPADAHTAIMAKITIKFTLNKYTFADLILFFYMEQAIPGFLAEGSELFPFSDLYSGNKLVLRPGAEIPGRSSVLIH